MDPGVAAALVLPGLGTAVGGLFLAVFRHPSDAVLDSLLGFTAGVMLGATWFGLLTPALDEASPTRVAVAVAAGVGVLAALDRALPHAHARFAERGRAPAEQQVTRLRSTLLVAAMTIHNVPEGLAVGAALAGDGWETGLPIAVAIGIQNVPEGFAAGAPLLRTGSSLATAIGVAAATGLVEPPCALAAYAVLDVVEPLLALGLGFAAGAMLYVVVDELIPESRSHGHGRRSTAALVLGFALMMALDQLLA